MVPGIQSTTDRVFCHFLPFSLPINPKNKNSPEDITILNLSTTTDDHIMFGSKVWSAMNIIFCHFGPIFALLSPYQPRKSTFL